MKKYIAEAVGTAVLVMVGCGTAIFTGGDIVATSLAFGLSVVAMAYCVGNISGCHINPAITVGMLIDGRIDSRNSIFYIVAQVIGGLVGALLLYVFLTQTAMSDFIVDTYLGCNGFGDYSAVDLTMFGALLVEILLTFVFVFAALGVTSTKATAAQGGIVIGLALTLVHLIGISLTGTSVNPARSLGPAIVLAIAGESAALGQVWVFIVAPIIGAVLAGFLWKYLKPAAE